MIMYMKFYYLPVVINFIVYMYLYTRLIFSSNDWVLVVSKVEGIFYINDLLEKLMFDELKHWAGTQGTAAI